jgi:hypothetical protein
MALQTILITVTTIGVDATLFTISDNVSGVIATNVTANNLLTGYTTQCDSTATLITVESNSPCSTTLEIPITAVTPTPTPTNTATPTNTPTATVTSTPGASPSPTSTQTQTPTPTNTATPTNTPTATVTSTPGASPSPTSTQTPTPTNTQTSTPTNTPTTTNTSTPAASPSPTQTPTPTNTSTPTNTETPTNTPTETPTNTPTPTPTTICDCYTVTNTDVNPQFFVYFMCNGTFTTYTPALNPSESVQLCASSIPVQAGFNINNIAPCVGGLCPTPTPTQTPTQTPSVTPTEPIAYSGYLADEYSCGYDSGGLSTGCTLVSSSIDVRFPTSYTPSLSRYYAPSPGGCSGSIYFIIGNSPNNTGPIINGTNPSLTCDGPTGACQEECPF